jgi:hypothetical protein
MGKIKISKPKPPPKPKVVSPKAVGDAFKKAAKVFSRTPIGYAVNFVKGAAACHGNASCINKEAKKTTTGYAQSFYKYSGAETIVKSGKALSQCKPNDAKCIAMNMGKIVLAAKDMSPTGMAKTMAKNMVKEQVENVVREQMAKRKAQEQQKNATNEQQKQAAAKEIKRADDAIKASQKIIEVNEDVIKKADTEQKAAQAELEKLKSDPATAEKAKKLEKEVTAAKASGALSPDPKPAKPAESPQKKNSKFLALIISILMFLVMVAFVIL